MVHGYMSNTGFEDVRRAIADNLNKRFGTTFSQDNLIMTVGAASGINVVLKTILNPGDEVQMCIRDRHWPNFIFDYCIPYLQ